MTNFDTESTVVADASSARQAVKDHAIRPFTFHAPQAELDELRRRILEMLKERDLTAGQIAEAFSMTAPSISYHLDLLKHAQLVSSRKNGQFLTYSLETTVLDDSLGWILDLMKKGKRK